MERNSGLNFINSTIRKKLKIQPIVIWVLLAGILLLAVNFLFLPAP